MGNLNCLEDVNFTNWVSELAVYYISRENGNACNGQYLPWNCDEQYIVDLILRISNAIYNNSTAGTLVLDDGIYDQLLVCYKKYNPHYQVGAVPIKFIEQSEDQIDSGKRVMYHTVNDNDLDSRIYTHNITAKMRPRTMYTLVQPPISKRLINTKHEYPELVGTLDKCKFVLNHDAIEAGVFDNQSVQVFERDFIQPCLASGIIRPDEVFTMIGELKYDGVSVETKVRGDRIISAYSRGDTAEDIATDLTPIFSGYRFYKAKNMPTDIDFGIKHEAVITRRGLELLSQLRGRDYKNGRNAIIGLLGASDAYRFLDYITLIPIATSFKMDRIDELNFLNKYYHSGEYNRFCVFKGNYQEILFQVKQFTESAEIIRSILPYMIDGVVISFVDPWKIEALGRVNSVNKYQMAVKFNPRKVRTIFLNYTYSIGKSGDIIPMVHFKPAEFIGTIHTKQTIHSYQRFKDLQLISGQEIDVDYVNDVISYVTKPDTAKNREIASRSFPVEFITHCPCCGTEIVISDSGKSAFCPNIHCHERMIMRMVDMVDKLGFKDIGEETIRLLDITNFIDLVNMAMHDSSLEARIGTITSQKLRDYVTNLLNNPINDYKILAAMSFEAMAEEKWKNILAVYPLNLLVAMNQDQLRYNLGQIHGVGPGTANSIANGLLDYHDEVDFICKHLHIVDFKNTASKPKVALTGTRDPMLIDIIRSERIRQRMLR